MWKCLYESCRGISHVAAGTECQDASIVTRVHAKDDELLVLVCADGAGSAHAAAVGARVACMAVTQKVATDCAGRSLSLMGHDDVRGWFGEAHAEVEREAKMRNTGARELACTLLVAVLGKQRAMFGQIGDGAIVIRRHDSYVHVFWPQSGEYANTTHFITQADYGQHIQTHILDARVDEVAMFTDGLQMLALDFARRKPHAPFFEPMFSALRATPDTNDLIVPMRQFLDSEGVNARTNDDKTLILALRACNVDAIV